MQDDQALSWTILPDNRSTTSAYLDLSSGFDDKDHLLAAISNLRRFEKKVDVLVLGGTALDTIHLSEALLIDGLRVLVLDSSTLCPEKVNEITKEHPQVTILNSHRTWIRRLQAWNTGLQRIVAKKQLRIDGSDIITDEHLFRIVEISRIRGFHVSGEPVPEEILEWIPHVDTLQYLDLSESSIDDEYLKQLKGLDGLVSLRLDETDITGNTLDALPESLIALSLMGNRLEKKIPFLPNLRGLDISHVKGDTDYMNGDYSSTLSWLNIIDTELSNRDRVTIGNLSSLKELVIEAERSNDPMVSMLRTRSVNIVHEVDFRYYPR